MKLEVLLKFDPAKLASDDRRRHCSGVAISDMAWQLARTVATGLQPGGIVPYEHELKADRERLQRLLKVAVAGGWQGLDLLDALMDEGKATEQLERTAREAGLACKKAPDLLDRFLNDEIQRLVTPSISNDNDDSADPVAA